MVSNLRPVVWVLGAQGMVGRTVEMYLSDNDVEVHGTGRQKDAVRVLRAEHVHEDWEVLTDSLPSPTLVVNAIGKLRNDETTDRDFKRVNELFPLAVEQLTQLMGARLFHISTDAVFPIDAGAVSESVIPHPEDAYGKSKLAGETTGKSSMTVRTSLVGFDPAHKRGLVEWVRGSSQQTIHGYTNQRWSGCTNLQLAQLVEWLVVTEHFETLKQQTNVLHFAPIGPVSKYELVTGLASAVGTGPMKVEKALADRPVDRYLTSTYTTLLPELLKKADLIESLEQLLEFEYGR